MHALISRFGYEINIWDILRMCLSLWRCPIIYYKYFNKFYRQKPKEDNAVFGKSARAVLCEFFGCVISVPTPIKWFYMKFKVLSKC